MRPCWTPTTRRPPCRRGRPTKWSSRSASRATAPCRRRRSCRNPHPRRPALRSRTDREGRSRVEPQGRVRHRPARCRSRCPAAGWSSSRWSSGRCSPRSRSSATRTSAPRRSRRRPSLKVGDAADPFTVENGRRKIEEFYQKKGYSKVRVTILEGNKPGDLRAIYLINEGPKQKILWIKFVGNTIVSGQRLRHADQVAAALVLHLQGRSRPQADRRGRRAADGLLPRPGVLPRPRRPRAGVQREAELADADLRHRRRAALQGPQHLVHRATRRFTTEQLVEKLKLKGGEFFNQAPDDRRRDRHAGPVRRHRLRVRRREGREPLPRASPASWTWSTTSPRATATAWAGSTSRSRARIRTRGSRPC